MSERTSNAIRISIELEIPVGTAVEAVHKLEALLKALPEITFQVENKETKAERLAARKADLEAKKREFERTCVQVFRQFRRIAPNYQTPNAAYRAIAYPLEWPVGVVGDVVAKRRAAINRYLNSRRPKTALRLAKNGLNDAEIAECMGVGIRTVRRYLKEARTSEKGGRNGR